MNYVEEFYEKKKLLNTIKSRCIGMNSFFYRTYTTKIGVNIELTADLAENITAQEAVSVKYLIMEWINQHRGEIEKHLKNRLKESLEATRLIVNEDFKEFKKKGDK